MYAIEMIGITKRFGPLIANNSIDFQLEQGEVHALLGENGAGKTTLMRILFGLYRPDHGKIIVKGNDACISSPKDAIGLGIGIVTQHFSLVPTLSVAENCVLGCTKGFFFKPQKIEQEVKSAAQRFGIDVKPHALVRHLCVGERQRVEILKSLYRGASVLIMDEPTAVLVPQEVEILFETLSRLRKAGMSIIFISHKLNEVMAICDRITVLRGGSVIGRVNTKDTTQTELASMMVGDKGFGDSRQNERAEGKPVVHTGRAAFGVGYQNERPSIKVLQIKALHAKDKKGLPALKGIDLNVEAGEILGIAGVSGNGQTELSQVLSGTLKPTSGQVMVSDQDLSCCGPYRFTAARVGRIPEDRHEGVVGELTVAENMAIEYLDEFTEHGILNTKKIMEHAKKLIEEYQIKASPQDQARTLSGGNMQKIILARALSRCPQLVLASQPTRGLDIGATQYVRYKLIEQRDRGAAVMLISEDLDEIMALSDRIAVIYEGRITGIIPRSEASLTKLGLMMSGANEVKREIQN